MSIYNFSMPPLSDLVNPPDQIERLDNFRGLYGFVEITSPVRTGSGRGRLPGTRMVNVRLFRVCGSATSLMSCASTSRRSNLSYGSRQSSASSVGVAARWVHTTRFCMTSEK
jgi:hypothetical protein